MVGQGRIQQIGEESRQRILDAAEELFSTRGYIETSLADVAERSGISRGSIPWHFENKAGLLMAVVERATATSSQEIAPGLDNLEQATAAIADRMRQPHMGLLHMLLGEATKPDSPIRDSYVAYHDRDRATIRQWITDSQWVDLPGIDQETLAILIYSLFIGIHLQWRISPEQIDLDESLSGLATLVRAAATS